MKFISAGTNEIYFRLIDRYKTVSHVVYFLFQTAVFYQGLVGVIDQRFVFLVCLLVDEYGIYRLCSSYVMFTSRLICSDYSSSFRSCALNTLQMA